MNTKSLQKATLNGLHILSVTEVENLFFADGNVVIVFNNGNKQLLENVKSVNVK